MAGSFTGNGEAGNDTLHRGHGSLGRVPIALLCSDGSEDCHAAWHGAIPESMCLEI